MCKYCRCFQEVKVGGGDTRWSLLSLKGSGGFSKIGQFLASEGTVEMERTSSRNQSLIPNLVGFHSGNGNE
jgi:hypothetical protein